jgi:hypothetical protein
MKQHARIILSHELNDSIIALVALEVCLQYNGKQDKHQARVKSKLLICPSKKTTSLKPALNVRTDCPAKRCAPVIVLQLGYAS